MKIQALNRKVITLKNDEINLIITVLSTRSKILDDVKKEQVSRTKKPLPFNSPIWQQLDEISQAEAELGFSHGFVDKYYTKIICENIDRTERTEQNAEPLRRLLQLLEEGRR